MGFPGEMAVDSRAGGGKQISLGLLCQEEEKHSDEDGGVTEGQKDTQTCLRRQTWDSQIIKINKSNK